jgi:hypothetical protein
VVTVVAVIIIATIVFVIAVAALVACGQDTAAQAQARQLDRRVHSAEQQIHVIGQRTRAAIIAEARRRQQQGKP